MSKVKDDTAPQMRLCTDNSLKFLNFNRRMPMLSAVKDTVGAMHQLIFGAENTVFIDASHLTHEELDIPFELEDIRAQIQGTQDVSEGQFNIKSLANTVLLVQLPSKVSLEIEDVLLNKISYKIPTIFIPANIKSTFKLQGKMIVLPEVSIKPDLQTERIVNWDAFYRLVEYINTYENWKDLHKCTPVGRFSLPVPDQALVKMEIE